MEYRCVTTSLEGFIQQLAVSYVGRGYWFYTTGLIPEGKPPEAVDEKLVFKYGITAKKWERARRKQNGLANMQYIRYGRFFVLIATDGRHLFRERESSEIRDVRRNAIRYGGYQVAYRNGHPQIRMDDRTYEQLKAYYVDLACRRSAESLIEEFYAFPFEPYAPIRRQAFNILRAVNRKRKRAGYRQLPTSCIWLKRKIVKPFEATWEDGVKRPSGQGRVVN